ncbi:EAL domain-containing protein [Cyanobium sp. FGCU-52]|nr:EAL domain-containing protein [Cyanobium sp. FGCU52]
MQPIRALPACTPDRGSATLADEASLYRQLLDLVDGACVIVDPRQGRLIDANAAACSQLGYDHAAFLALSPEDLLEDGDSDAARRQLRAIWRRRETTQRARLHHRSGTLLEVEVLVRRVCVNGVSLLLVARQQRSELLRIQNQLMRTNLMLAEAQKVAQIGSWEMEHRTQDLIWSEETFRIFETTPDRTTPTYAAFLQFVHPEDRDLVTMAFQESLDTGRPYEVEHRLLLPGGTVKVVVERGTTRFDGQRTPLRSIGTVQDVTAFNAVKVQLEHAAFVDAVTELPNRNASLRHLHLLLREGSGHRSVAVINLDLDHFQAINDSFGMVVGNRVLIEASGKLRAELGPEAWLARIGSDEFLVIAPSIGSIGAARQLAQRLQACLAAPHRIEEEFSVVATVSAGVSVWPEHAVDATDLLQAANTAMMEAKSRGSQQLAVYSTVLSMRITERIRLEQELARAIDRSQLALVFQPQVDRERRVMGMEALLRWTNGHGQAISPACFVPIAESTGLIHAIGDWVLEQAFQQLQDWQRQDLGLARLAINLSAVQLEASQPPFHSRIRAGLERHGIPPSRVEFELTETAIQRDPARVKQQLGLLAEMGCRLAIDDFGTGYSSLEVLHHLQLDTLKIDRCFVDQLSERDTDRSILAATIAMARQLGLTTLAEGVETEEQFSLLEDLGCDLFQGYLISPPIDAHAMGRVLQVPHLLAG